MLLASPPRAKVISWTLATRPKRITQRPSGMPLRPTEAVKRVASMRLKATPMPERGLSFALICVMCVALWTADRAAVTSLFSDPDKLFGTDPFLFLYASVLVFAFGPGKIALDTLVFKDKAA